MLFQGLVVSLAAAVVLGSPVDIQDDATALYRRQQPDHPEACLVNNPLRTTCRERHIENCRQNPWVTVACEPLYTAACQNHCYYDSPCIEGRSCMRDYWWLTVEFGGYDDMKDVPDDCPVEGDSYKACYGPELEWCRTKPRFSNPEHKDYVEDPEFCPQWAYQSCRRACHI